MQSTPAFYDITKIADFQWNNADVNRIQVVCLMIYIYFVDLVLGKVWLCQAPQ